jgi:hypothetical protein
LPPVLFRAVCFERASPVVMVRQDPRQRQAAAAAAGGLSSSGSGQLPTGWSPGFSSAQPKSDQGANRGNLSGRWSAYAKPGTLLYRDLSLAEHPYSLHSLGPWSHPAVGSGRGKNAQGHAPHAQALSIWWILRMMQG